MPNETKKTTRLDDKRWILRHVLVPVLLAIIPCYFAWMQGKALAQAEGKAACTLERETNMVIIRALVEQLRDEEGAFTPWPSESESVPGPPAPVPIVDMNPTEGIQDSDLDLSEIFANELPRRHEIDIQQIQAQQLTSEIVHEYEELEGILQEGTRARLRAKFIEGAKR